MLRARVIHLMAHWPPHSARKSDLVSAIQYASAFASLAVEQEGASSMPQHELVLHRMRTQSHDIINIK